MGTVCTGQDVKGTVSRGNPPERVPGVNIYWAGTTVGSASLEDGSFSIPSPNSFPAKLIFSFVGTKNDTIVVESGASLIKHRLSESILIEGIEITEEKAAFNMSAISTVNTESINRKVLKKAACCNLSESFETTAAVDVVLNDAITGTRKIQMLGLEGIYVQNLFEGVQFSRGLSNVLGFDQIPGPWIESIQLTKGAGVASGGYESMTGQINLLFIQPDDGEKLYADVFANNQSRYETNVIYTKPLNKKWSTAFYLNGHQQDATVDMNDDGFLDMPRKEGFKATNHWKYYGDQFRFQLVGSYVEESRSSGQNDFNFENDFGSQDRYGFGLDMRQYDLFFKLKLLAKERQDRNLKLTGVITGVDIESYFGNSEYFGDQFTARGNLVYNSRFSMYSDHNISAGAHFLYDEYDESWADSSFSRIERVPGVSVEYTYKRPRYTLVAGLRNENHNIFGNQLSPRVHMKYDFRPLTNIRFTGGRGFRTPNVYADQLGLLATSRQVRIIETPEAEISWNTGLSFLHKFTLLSREAVFNTDYYYTEFENQLVVDRDASARQLLFYNLDGISRSHSFQTDFQFIPLKGVGVKLSYKYQLVETDYVSGMLEKPLIPNHRALFNIGYTSGNRKWFVDFTTNFYGTSRLPDTSENPENIRLSERSESFFLFHSQITREFKHFEVYLGSENLGNFIQSNAIVDPENPFGDFFDASMIYGPVNGRILYAGVRLNLNFDKQ